MKKVSARSNSFDQILFALILFMAVFGLLMVFSASSPSSFYMEGDPFFQVKKQAIWTVLGIITMFFFGSFDYKNYYKLVGPILIVNAVLLVLVLLIGTESKGATRWINLAGMSFQPSEFTKIAVIIAMAAYIAKLEGKKQNFGNVYIPVAVIAGIPCALLIFQPHFSAIMIICFTVLILMIIGGIKFKFFLPIVSLGGVAGVALVIFEPYRLKRIVAFLDPFADKLGDGWQIVQSLYAIGSGGIFGLGLGRSRQKYLYIPEPQNDFIFSIICEELGMFGGIIIIALFLVLLWRAIHIAVHAPDTFSSMIAVGIGILFTFQALFNMGVATSSVPPTGVSLPFFSAGGSALVFQMAMVGMLLNISRHSGKKKELKAL